MTTRQIIPSTNSVFNTEPKEKKVPEVHVEPSKTPASFADYVEHLYKTEDRDVFTLIGTKFVNQLTGQVAFNLDRHVRESLNAEIAPKLPRRKEDGDHAPTANMKDDDEYTPPDIDMRNEQDEAKRGQEVKDQVTEDLGYEVPMKPLEIAMCCERTRREVYAMLEARNDDLPAAKYILYTGDRSVAGFTSIESSARSRIENMLKPNEARIATLKRNASALKISAEALIQDEMRSMKRFSLQAQERLKEVIETAKGLRPDEASNWDKLPEDTRNQIVARIRNNIAAQIEGDEAPLPLRLGRAVTEQAKTGLQIDIATHALALDVLDAWLDEHTTASASEIKRLAQLQARIASRNKSEAKKDGIDLGDIKSMVDDVV